MREMSSTRSRRRATSWAASHAIYESDVKWLEPVTDQVYKATPAKK